MIYASKDVIPNAGPTRKRVAAGMGATWGSATTTLPILSADSGAPSSPIMQTATTVSSQGDLPPNIQAGGCSQLLPGFYVGAGNDIFAPDGTNTGDYIDVDGQRLHSTGLPLCHGGTAYQDLGVPTVLSLPDDVRAALRNCGIASHGLAVLERQAQQAAVDAQAITGNDQGAPLLAAWNNVKDWVGYGQQLKNSADAAFAQFDAADEAVHGAYSNGNYQDPNVEAFVRQALTDYNHVPIAWANVQAAVQAVYDELYEYVVGYRLGSFNDAFMGMQREVSAVSDDLSEVTQFLSDLKANIARLPNPSKDIADDLTAAQPSIEGLNALALQVGSIWQVAQQQQAAAEAGAQDFANPTAVEQADVWIHNAYPAVYGVKGKADDFASDIHSKLDSLAHQIEQYIAQNPDKLKDPNAAAAGSSSSKGKTGLVLGLAAAALVAFKLKGVLAAT